MRGSGRSVWRGSVPGSQKHGIKCDRRVGFIFIEDFVCFLYTAISEIKARLESLSRPYSSLSYYDLLKKSKSYRGEIPPGIRRKLENGGVVC